MDEERQGFARLCIAFVAVYSATMIAFFVTGRYRVPVIPFVAMGAAVAIVSIIDLFCTRRFIRGTAMLLTAVLLTCVLNVDFLGIRAATGGWVEFTEAQDRLATGDLNGAIGILENVRKQNTVPVAELYSSLARAYVQRDNPADRDTILEVAEEGLRSHPDTPDLIWYAATVHMERREWKKASELIERYLAQRSSDIPALRVAFFAALFDGRPQDAARHLAAAEASDRTNPAVADMRRQLEKAQK